MRCCVRGVFYLASYQVFQRALQPALTAQPDQISNQGAFIALFSARKSSAQPHFASPALLPLRFPSYNPPRTGLCDSQALRVSVRFSPVSPNPLPTAFFPKFPFAQAGVCPLAGGGLFRSRSGTRDVANVFDNHEAARKAKRNWARGLGPATRADCATL